MLETGTRGPVGARAANGACTTDGGHAVNGGHAADGHAMPMVLEVCSSTQLVVGDYPQEEAC
jgi:hypothetical protein